MSSRGAELEKIYWRVAGQGAPLVLLHGVSSSSATFDPQFAGLTDQFELHAWDAPGYGHSADPAGPLSLHDYARLVNTHVAGLGNQRGPAHIVGVSWGGVLAAAAALASPELYASLTLISSSLGSGVDAGKAAAMRARPAALEKEGAESFARQRAPRLLSPAAPPQLVTQVQSTITEALRLPGYTSATQVMAATDLTENLAKISTPTMIVVGSEDRITGPAAGRQLWSALPQAAYFPVAGSGHLVNLESAGQVNQLLSIFASLVTGGVEQVSVSEHSERDHPYAPATEAAGLLFVSGALSVDRAGAPVAGRQQALAAAMANVKTRLASLGGELANVIKLTYYVTDITLRDEANDQIRQVFPNRRPARTFLEVSRLPYGATVEIDATAKA